MIGNEAIEDKGHGDGSSETHPNKQEESEPYRPQTDPVSPPPSGQQWCYCGSVPPPTHPYGIVCVQYHITPTIDSQTRSDHPAHGGHRASTEDTGHQGTGRVEMQHALQPMQPNPPVPQPWGGYPHSGYLPVPPLCHCGNLPPHHHPGGMVYLPYPNIRLADNRSAPDHPTHGGQHAVSTEGKGYHGAGKVEMQHTGQQMQPNPPVPQSEYGYPHCGYLPVPPFCYCGNIPPHHHPNGMVYMSYPNRPPADCQSRTEYPTPDAQLPSIEDNGHHRAGRSQMQFATQQMLPIPPVPQPWSESPHSEYLPVPSLCYCGNLPPHHHPNGSVYVPYPNSPPAGSQSRSHHPNHGGQNPASMEDKGHQGTGKVEMHHALQQMQPNPPEPHPWNGYPHCGHLPLPLCYCCNIPPHHHPGGMVYLPYPNIRPADNRSTPDHPEA
ncbi:extensin-2-like [Haliotis rubra]|uniref:extensin-2-like n=1 Tax=Haliotis rubra TaxID=36100 RepID=UPI001EE5DB7D|nr:extensin-2-like [Haliotis rubra]